MKIDRTIEARTKHGKVGCGAYSSWSAMVTRCTNQKATGFARYGGRGIKISDELRSFAAFYAFMGNRPPGMTLDRIDPDKGYEPGNVRWATQTMQQRNKTNNRMVTLNGKTQTAAAWCEETGIPWGRLKMRLKRGWTVERALTE